MRTGFLKSRLVAWLSLLLAAGFLATGLFAYLAASHSIRDSYTHQSIPAVAALAHSELLRDLKRLSDTAEAVAGQGFVANWQQSGERDESPLVQRINEAEKRSGLSDSTLFSIRTQRQYRAGSRRGSTAFAPLAPDAAAAQTIYRINPHPDPNDNQAFAIQAERRIAGDNGLVTGTLITGLPRGYLKDFVERFRSTYGVEVRLVDRNGIILAGADAMRHLREIDEFRESREAILAGTVKADTLSYSEGHATIHIESRSMPELGAHLLVSGSDKNSIAPVWSAFLLNIAIAGGVILLVATSVLGTFEYYRRSLIEAPGQDAATGLINRSAYEFVFRQTMLETARSKEPLSLILVEVDAFHKLAKAAGPKGTDRVLKEIGALAKASVRVSDPVARWSENRFVIQLRDCPLDKAFAAGERLRQRVVAHAFGLEEKNLAQVTISLGAAILDQPEETGNDFLQRLEKVLDQAIAHGGNRVEPRLEI